MCAHRPSFAPAQHIGTLPDRRGDIFVSDLRMMVSATDEGFRPIAVYARKAHKPLIDAVPTKAGDAWQVRVAFKHRHPATSCAVNLVFCAAGDVADAGHQPERENGPRPV